MADLARAPDREMLVKWMALKGRTQQEAADALGCTQSYISHWLRHEVELSRSKVGAWAEVLAPRARFPVKHKRVRRTLTEAPFDQ